MYRQIRRWLFRLALLGSVVLVALGSECIFLPDEEKDAATLTAEGWTQYEAHNYSAAIDRFNQAIDKDPTYADAYNGRGWSYAKLEQLDNAMTNFNSAISKNSGLWDAYAGKAFVASAQNDHPAVISAATSLISGNSSWTFSHEPDISISDVRLVLAQSYFYLGQYDNARAQVNLIPASNDIDPGNPDTWVVSEVKYNTYKEALSKEIQRLESIV